MNSITDGLKKKMRLAALEAELRRLLARGADRDTLLAAALEIRDGRIRVLRALQQQNPERNADERAIVLKHETKIQELRELTAEAILAEYAGS